MSSKAIKTSFLALGLLSIILIIFVTIDRQNQIPSKLNMDLLRKEAEYDDLAIKNSKKILSDFLLVSERNDTLNISSLITDDKLVYRFNELHCNSCVLNEFDNIKLNFDTKDKIDHLIIITKYENIRLLYLFKRLNGLRKYTMYNLVEKQVNDLSNLENIGLPYFFVIDKNLTVKKTFVPLKGRNERTAKFMREVK